MMRVSAALSSTRRIPFFDTPSACGPARSILPALRGRRWKFRLSSKVPGYERTLATSDVSHQRLAAFPCGLPGVGATFTELPIELLRLFLGCTEVTNIQHDPAHVQCEG